MIKILAILLGLVFIMPAAGFALESFSICLNQTVMETNTTYTQVYSDGGVNITTLSRDTFCSYGCNNVTRECRGNNTNLDYGFIIIGSLIAIGVFMAFITWLTREKHMMISFTFFFMGMIDMMLIVGTAGEIARDAGQFTIATITDALVLPIGVIMFISMLYFFIRWLLAVSRYLKDRKEEKLVGP